MSSVAVMPAPERYLDLLKKSLLEELYVENELRILYLRNCLENKESFDDAVFLNIARARSEMFREYVTLRDVGINYERKLRNLGFQHTMIGRQRLENIEFCLQEILRGGVPGDCIECGVWRGGATIFMRGFLAAHGITDRAVWVADSFEGLPKPTLKEDANLDLSAERFPMLVVSLETVRDLFQRYGLLDDQVNFLKGWFKDTLPAAPIERLALLRIDGDLYESTMNALESLYDKVSPRGFIVVDDYGVLPQCMQAVNDFRRRFGITEPLQQVDWSGVFWQRRAA